MLMKKNQRTWPKEEKERIILDIQKIGVVAGCRKHDIAPALYYIWLEKYQALGVNGLDRSKAGDKDGEINRLKRELALAKEIIAEKELQLKMKGELLKKRIAQWNKDAK